MDVHKSKNFEASFGLQTINCNLIVHIVPLKPRNHKEKMMHKNFIPINKELMLFRGFYSIDAQCNKV